MTHENMGTAHTKQRIHYMDYLRSACMFLVILSHALAGYAAQVQNYWFITHIPTSNILSITRIFIHDVTLPLFFLITGFFAHFLIQKRGVASFLKNRTIRIALPLILFSVLTHHALYETYIFGTSYLGDETKTYIKLKETSANFTLHHLWFLRYLFEFHLLCALMHKINAPWIKKADNFIFSSRLSLLFIPLLILPGQYLAPEHIPAPIELEPQLWTYLYYGAFFFLGWHIFSKQKFIEIIYSNLGKLTLIATILFSLQTYTIMYNFEHQIETQPNLITSLYISYLSCYLVLIAVGISYRFLNTNNHKVRYISDSSYWIYIIHLPIVYFLQILLAPIEFSLWLKLPIVLITTLVISAVSYHLFVRYTFIGTWINGKRIRP